MKIVSVAFIGSTISLACLAAISPSSAAVTFDYSEVSAHTNTVVGGQTGIGDGFDQAFSGSVDPTFNISASASSAKSNLVKKPKPHTVTLGTSNANSNVLAAFDSPSSGSIAFTQSGTVSAPVLVTVPALASAEGQFYYNFTVDRKSNILFDFDFSSTGTNADASTPSQYYQIFAYGPSIVVDSATFSDGALGAFANVLGAGSYQLYVGNYYFGSPTTAGLNSPSAVPVSTSLAGNYSFAITDAVPEPASWAMMISGFGMVGGTMRRRKLNVRLA